MGYAAGSDHAATASHGALKLLQEAQAEVELISRERGEEIAMAWAASPRDLKTPASLLSSQDIIEVVSETGLISPFFTGGKKTRLKKATYEGRIGEKAYIFKDRTKPDRIFDRKTNELLVVPSNSIVFVECDLDFRIPDFMALRFNLQIRHVHRGLLLGTGPLIDPGFWGKLCIPLHNLTDADYEIPRDEGLIWIEFTKTALKPGQRDPARKPLDGEGNWDIEKFLEKAANQYTGEKVPIRSSLPTIFLEANESVRKSAKDAESAKDDAKRALESADKMRNYNFFAMIAAAIGIVSVVVAMGAFVFNITSKNADIAYQLRSDVGSTKSELANYIASREKDGGRSWRDTRSIAEMRNLVKSKDVEIKYLHLQLGEMEKRIDALEERN